MKESSYRLKFVSTGKIWWNFLADNRFVVIHLFAWLGIYLLLGFFNWVRHIPDNGNVSWFDAGWYRSIRDMGYVYDAEQQSNVAFFPLFPFIWKMLHLNNIRMGLVNWFICLLSMILLKRSFRWQNREALLFLSLPSMLFMYLPYTEACFLFFCSFLLVGLYERKLSWLLVGLFFSSLVRPTAMFYIPAVFFSEFVRARLEGESLRVVFKRTALYGGVSLLALLLVALLQRYQTGEWFVFFEVQGKFWNHRFTWPQLPFTTWSEARILWIDAIALCFGLMAALFSLVWFIRAFSKPFKDGDTPPVVVLFSTAFLSLSTFSVVFFDARISEEGTTLLSLNRYILASPFFLVFLWHLLKPGTRLGEYSLYALLSIAVMLYCIYPVNGEYVQLDHFRLTRNLAELYLLMIAVYVLSYLLLKFERLRNDFMGALYVINMLMQIYLLNEFLVMNWVG